MRIKVCLISFFLFSILTKQDLSAQSFPENSGKPPLLTKIDTYSCGRQPKQVLFSPDSGYIALPLLDDKGFDIFSLLEKKIIKRITPPSAEKLGFAEGLFIPSKKTFLVSQMTTANIYEYSYPDFELKRAIPTCGEWSKFIAYSPERELLCVSNWISNDISIIEYKSGKLLRKIKTAASPRGLLFTDEGRNIIVLCFDGGKIQKFSTETGARLAEKAVEKSAMRHIVAKRKTTDSESRAYVSDMYHAQIYEIDLNSLNIIRKVRVHNNPNTIALYDDRWLFVSCRGKNNPEDYTKRSLENGQIYVIDTENMTVCTTFEGGNQPTGLDISPDESLLCFSNFQDSNIELYSITR